MFYEFLSFFPIHQQGMYYALGLMACSFVLMGWILYSCRLQNQELEAEPYPEDFHDDALIPKQLDESQRIEQEAREFYSKPSTVRYRLSGMERLRTLQGQNQNPDSEHSESPISPLHEMEESSENEEASIWNQAIISSITFRKPPEQQS